MDPQLKTLIDDYMKLAQEVRRLFSKQAGVEHILLAVNSGGILREGKFHGFGGGEYFIHGCGCRLLAKELEIDFDFDSSGGVTGFDAWKLYDYARNHADAYPWVTSRDAFEALLNQHLESGALNQIERIPNSHLLCPTWLG